MLTNVNTLYIINIKNTKKRMRKKIIYKLYGNNIFL